MSARLGVPLAVLAAGGTWMWLGRGLPLRGPEGPGPGFVPALLSGVLVVLGLALLIEARRAAPARAEGAGWRQAALVLSLLLLYVVALAHVGYFAATPPFVGCCWPTC